MKKEKLLIIGASGHGKVVADVALQMKKWDKVVFIDDDEAIKTSLGLDVVGKTTDIDKYFKDYDIFVGIGNNKIRKKIQKNIEQKGVIPPILIHPKSVIGSEVSVGPGTVVMAGTIINSSTKIGKGCIINTGSTIDHDNFIESYVHISPGVHLAGTVKVGSESWLGIGSLVSNNLKITKRCIVGAGSLVMKDLFESGTYVGRPAKKT